MRKELVEFTDLATRIEDCDDIEDLWRVTESFGREQGFPRLGCAYADVGRVGNLETPAIRTNCTESRMNAWTTGKLYMRDPAVQRARTSCVGFCWGIDYLQRSSSDPRLRTFYGELARSTARSVFIVPLPRVRRGALGVGMLCNDMDKGEFEAHVAGRFGLLTMAMTFADRRMDEICGAARRSAVGLLPREAECLEWMATGAGLDGTAERMGLAKTTVQAHLETAKRKLGVASIEHAIAVALKDKLIRP